MTCAELNVVGGTQPEIFAGTVDAIASDLLASPSAAWAKMESEDGPINIWTVNGQRYLTNGNHRYQAALRLGIDIPNESVNPNVVAVDAPVWLFEQMTWMPGLK